MSKTARRILKPEGAEGCVVRSCHGVPCIQPFGQRGGPMPPRSGIEG